ncbi:hypothetical protein NE237_022971 [Protea cynaroides]|uniref:Pentatricopeptide repeat-containing protein n=1 Tax=Protea cynaroides TaxID=273540 RepID=A0A9Q0K4Z6_9MAGN|nr:hypothetical protein NE237_022971 [Protea cynaroides]
MDYLELEGSMKRLSGLLDRARSLQLEISKSDCFPDSTTYTILICGLCKEGLVGEAGLIFNEMEKLGCLPTVITFNALIDGLCKVGELDKARLLFHKMEIGRNPSLILHLRLSQGSGQVLDSVSLQKLVEQYCESGLILKAYKLLIQLADSGVVPNIITYNILMNGLCKTHNINAALKLFEKLQVDGYSPDVVTYGTLIDGLQRVNREEEAFGYFDQMVKNGCTPSLAIYNTLMTSLCRTGKLSQAFSLWLNYLRSLPNWEGEAIKAVEEQFENGKVEDAVRGLLKLGLMKKVTDSSPYTIWLIGLCQAGSLDEAVKIFSILEEHKVKVTPPSCVMLISGLCREGKLDLAVDVFLYTLEKGLILMPRVCNGLIRSLYTLDRKKDVIDLMNRMRRAGYDLDIYLSQTTKVLLSRHKHNYEMERESTT